MIRPFYADPAQHDPYRCGDRDIRPWGDYTILQTGQESDGREFCIKRITIKPRSALSLQQHHWRREDWMVEEGILTAIIDSTLYNLYAGNRISVPLGAPHAMINYSGENVVIHERQTGICRESDNDRLMDLNGRATCNKKNQNQDIGESCQLYQNAILPLLKKRHI
jgi:mannose-6-phosphate isomerase-like protein (cupin superfamily)